LTLDQTSSASVSLELSNLTSAAAGARLELVRAGQPSVVLGNLPAGATSGTAWSVSPATDLTPEELIQALIAGQLRLSVASDAHPAGELVGYLRPAGRPAGPEASAPAPAASTAPRD